MEDVCWKPARHEVLVLDQHRTQTPLYDQMEAFPPLEIMHVTKIFLMFCFFLPEFFLSTDDYVSI